jgi:competence protein ComFC
MYAFARAALDLFFPPRCQVCRRFAPVPICLDCQTDLRLIQPPLCEHCGLPLDPKAAGPALCRDCLAEKRSPIAWARAAGLYEGALRKAILALKFQGRRSLAPELAQMLVAAVQNDALAAAAPPDLVCPVPLHPSRQAERGFNQSALLAHYFCERTGNELDCNLLFRTRPTIPQVALPRPERGRNVRGAFAVSEGKEIKGAKVLLIDDIYTTGSTLEECAHVLRRGGAADVYVLTLARPRPEWMVGEGN